MFLVPYRIILLRYLLTFLALDVLQDEAHRLAVDNVHHHGFNFDRVVVGLAQGTVPVRAV